MEDLLSEIRDTRRQAQAERDAATEARHRSEAWATKLESGVRDLESERARVLNEARAQAEREVALAHETVQALLRRAESAATREAAAEARSGLDAVVEALATREPGPGAVVPAAPADLAPGARVRVVSFGTEGEVVGVKGSQVEVQVGRMRLTARLRDIELLAPAPEPEVAESGVHLRRAAASPAAVPVELDLRGLRVEDGLQRLDAYLDEAVLSGMPFSRIIHGHGTGAMKAAVRDALRRAHPQVKRFRPGEQGEGGDGATVAYFE